MTEPRTLDLIVVAVYMAGTVAFGALFWRRSGTAESFTVGSGSMAGWVVGLSMLGTFVSSLSFLGNPGKSYTDNWVPLTFSLTVPLLALLAGYVFVPLYRSRNIISGYAYLEEQFGYWARAYGSLSFIVLNLGRVSLVLYLAALVIAPMSGLSLPAIILIVGGAVTVYSMMGGIRAVIWTDALQVAIMIGGAVWCLIDVLVSMPGGPGRIFDIASNAGGKFSLGEMSLQLSNQTLLGVVLFGILDNLQNFGINQNYIQRYLTAESDRAARKALMVTAIPFIPMTALFLLIGTALFAFYQVQPELLPANVSGDFVFPHFIQTQLPPGVSGLLVAAILAAAMSTVSSSVNSMATVLVEDFFKRRWMPNLSAGTHMWLLRALTAVLGVGGAALGLLAIGFGSVLDLFWQISAMVGSGLLGIFILAVVPWTFPRRAVQAALAITVTFVLWGNFSPYVVGLPEAWQSSLDPLIVGAVGTVLLIGVATLLKLVWPPKQA